MKRPTATALLFAAAASAATSLPCEDIQVDGHKYNFGELRGPHVVVTSELTPPTWHNTTYALDLCGPLKRKDDVPKEERCPDNTIVCAIKHRWDPKTGKTDTDQVIPIKTLPSGDEEEKGWDVKRLPADEGAAEGKGKREGLQLTLSGTTYLKRKQKAVIEFRCDDKKKGDEGQWESPPDEYLGASSKSKREDDSDNSDGWEEKQLKKEGAALIWDGYKRVDGDVDTLHLTWYTKFACDKAEGSPTPGEGEGEGDGDKQGESSHWGFFTWVFFLAFMLVAAYLVFGSWLNYNRYGARGWDLLPHGDTIRDIPYLLKDWTRRVLNTVQSSGSRGGYSAV